MYDYRDVATMIEDHPAAFAASATWGDFVQALGKPHLVDYKWAANGFDTAKRNPRIHSGRPLVYPDASDFSDLFESLSLRPAYTPAVDRRGRPYNGPARYPGLVPIFAGTHPSPLRGRNVGGERYVVAGFSDGSVCRGHKGSAFHVWFAKPKAGVDLSRYSSLEVISWGERGHLVTGTTDSTLCLREWVAVLAPEADLSAVVSEAARSLVAAEDAADAAAWGCITSDPNGVDRLDESRCSVRVERRR